MLRQSATFSAQLLIIFHWIAAIFSADFGLSRHLAEGCLAKTPVLVHGGSKITKSACMVKGKGAHASAITGSAILVPMRAVSFFHTFILLFEKSIELCCLRYALAELNMSFWRRVQRKHQKPRCRVWGLRLVRRSSLLYLECKISLLCSWVKCLGAFSFPRFCR